MKTHAALSAGLLLLALAPGEAQVKIQVEGGGLIINGRGVINGPNGGPIILNGGQLIINGQVIQGGENPEGEGQKPDASATSQVLEFADGSRLHGTLEKIDGGKKEIVWNGMDASGLLTFPLGQVSRWDAPVVAKPAVKVRATVKLSGADWLGADLVEITKDKIRLALGDSTPVSVDRARVEWIYFSKSAAAECYDGPVSMAGWASDGNWTYREGALRTAQPAAIGRLFEALPDQVEYRFEFDQGGTNRAMAVLLHGAEPATRGFGPGMVRLMINDTQLQLWAQRQDQMKQEQVDLSKILPARPAPADGSPPAKLKPMRWRIFEDRPAGRLVVFIDGRKVADWKDVGKAKEGENRGSFSIQPMAWGGETEQVISKIRVTPWDGFVPVDDAIEDVRPKTDQVIMADGDRNAGRIEAVTADKVQIGGEALPRDKVVMMRFAKPATPPDEDPPAGRVRLAQRGEFEVTALGFQEGKLRVRTNFGGEMTLAPAALRGLEFAHLTPVAAKPVDVVLFKNGDQLRGVLGASASGQKLRWQTAPETPAVELDVARLAGVALAVRAGRPESKTGVLARCRNGDLLAGDFVSIDKDRLTLESGAAGRLTIPRERLQAVYFAREGKLPVLDGAADHEVWEKGLDLNRGNAFGGAKKPAVVRPPASRWSYFDGVFAAKRASRSGGSSDGNLNLGRVVEGMPDRVEFSFDVSGKKNQIFFSTQLFSEPNNPGYMMQIHPGGLYIYDTGGQRRGQGQQNVQVQFGDKVKADALQHRIRILADRPSGRMTVLMDEVVLASFGPKSGGAPRNLGRGLALMPQQNMACAFSNLWVAPWNGQMPAPAPAGALPTDSVLLANGDETQGKIGSGTPEKVQMESEIGSLDMPVSRLTMLEFGGSVPEAAAGVRLRLSDRSVLTVSAYRIEKDTVVCQSAVLGEFKLPLSAVQEIVLGRLALPLAAAPGESSGGVREGVIIRR